MAELLDEIHPGEILLEEFMKPMGISARQLAADIDVSPSRISAVGRMSRRLLAGVIRRMPNHTEEGAMKPLFRPTTLA